MARCRRSALLMTVTFCFLAHSAPADATEHRPDAANRARIADPSLLWQATIPVALVTVDAVEVGDDGTSATLRAKEALRGTFPAAPFRVVVWPAIPSDPPGTVEALADSKPGEVWIAFFSPSAGTPGWLIEAHRSSDELLDYVRANLTPAERRAAIQGPALLLVLSLPLFSKVLLRRKPRALWLAILLQLGLYAFYESGVPASSDMRVDLLVAYPAHLAARHRHFRGRVRQADERHSPVTSV